MLVLHTKTFSEKYFHLCDRADKTASAPRAAPRRTHDRPSVVRRDRARVFHVVLLLGFRFRPSGPSAGRFFA